MIRGKPHLESVFANCSEAHNTPGAVQMNRNVLCLYSELS